MKSKIWHHPGWYLWPVPAIAAFVIQRVLADSPALAEQWHSRHLFRWISLPIGYLTSLVPFSLTEMLVVLGCPLLLAGLIYWLVRMIKRPARLARTGRLACRLAWILSIIYFAFMLLHGFNYARLSVAENFGLPAQERSADDLETTAFWLAQKASQLRAGCEEDSQGVFKLHSSIAATLQAAEAGYESAAAEYPLLDGAAIRPKGVLLSHYWSYTGITGLYFPLLVESNVNIDVPAYQLPATALHEIAHTRGFAREDEAGFIAFLAGLAHPSPEYAYSAMLDAAIRCMNALYTKDEEAYQEVAGQLSEAVWRDLAAGNAYWKQFEGPVQTAANNVNNAYLKANLQEDGVQSYGRMIDLVLAWYEAKAEEGTLNRSVASIQATAAKPLPKG